MACEEACAERAIDEMERHIGPDRIACMVAEPILGEGGFVVPGEGFLPTLREFAERNGILFVADEIQTGIGRTGLWFGIEHEGAVPDIVATAKALGGGLSLVAVTGTADAMEAIHVGGLGGTFGGNPVACRAALAVLDTVEREHLLDRAGRIGHLMLGR